MLRRPVVGGKVKARLVSERGSGGAFSRLHLSLAELRGHAASARRAARQLQHSHRARRAIASFLEGALAAEALKDCLVDRLDLRGGARRIPVNCLS